MTKQELGKLVESKLKDMIDNQQVGYLQINVGVGGQVVIHKHKIEPPFKIIYETKKVLDKT